MHADLARLIELQQLELAAEEARRKIADEPRHRAELDARLAASQQAVVDAKQRLADSQVARRANEKDLAAMQARLSKYRDQLMEVKTNREYQAMQKEIEVAQHEVRAFEDRVLERMLEGDELAAAVKAAEAALKEDEKTTVAERDALGRDIEERRRQLERAIAERDALIAGLDPGILAVYQHAAHGRKGIGVAAARDGVCTLCHVRLRPQVFNEVRRNDRIIQCDSCQRILYFEAAAPAAQPSA